jgi:deoxyribose-phosphate aldolase
MLIDKFRKRFDTSLIEPHVNDDDVKEFVQKCKGHSDYIAGVAFNPSHLPLGAKLLRDADIDVVAIVAYPVGGIPKELKVKYAKYAIKHGANQIDMFMNLNAFKSGRYEKVKEDIETVLNVVKGKIKNLSVIPATVYLTDEEKKTAAKLIVEAGATIIKTNDGFGAITTVEDVKLFKESVGNSIKIMASGGILTAKLALEMFNAGADLIATANPFKIIDEIEKLHKWVGLK